MGGCTAHYGTRWCGARSAVRSARPPPTWWRGRQPPAGGAAGARRTGALDGRLTLLVLIAVAVVGFGGFGDLGLGGDDLSLLQRTLTLMSTTLRSLRAP